jgi:hypothetical protein
MLVDRKPCRFKIGQLLIGVLLTLALTYVSFPISDHQGTPQFVRYVLSPGFLLGIRFASSDIWLDWLGSFGVIAAATNMVYYGFIVLFVLRKLDWPKMPRNTNHRFWMEH